MRNTDLCADIRLAKCRDELPHADAWGLGSVDMSKNSKTMTDERWEKLMADQKASLTKEEIKAGWHFCYEYDGLLVGPDNPSTWCGCVVGSADGKNTPTGQ